MRLSNPRAMLQGEKARLSEPMLLDLGGLGVRALSSWRQRLLLVAGPSGDGGPFRLFHFDAKGHVEPVSGVDFTGLGPEGFFYPESGDAVLGLRDDETRRGRWCAVQEAE